MESHPSKLVGSRGSKNRYFDFDKLGEVRCLVIFELCRMVDVFNMFLHMHLYWYYHYMAIFVMVVANYRLLQR